MSPSSHRIVILTTFMTACLNPAFARATGYRSGTVNIIPLPVSVEQSSPGAPGFVLRASTRNNGSITYIIGLFCLLKRIAYYCLS